VIAVLLFASAELARARFEERALTAKLGATYRAYCEEVGGFFPQQLRRARVRSGVRRRP
jgi:protein-S-isoprenylcysteine O-methyltransferase Ste14